MSPFLGLGRAVLRGRETAGRARRRLGVAAAAVAQQLAEEHDQSPSTSVDLCPPRLEFPEAALVERTRTEFAHLLNAEPDLNVRLQLRELCTEWEAARLVDPLLPCYVKPLNWRQLLRKHSRRQRFRYLLQTAGLEARERAVVDVNRAKEEFRDLQTSLIEREVEERGLYYSRSRNNIYFPSVTRASRARAARLVQLETVSGPGDWPHIGVEAAALRWMEPSSRRNALSQIAQALRRVQDSPCPAPLTVASTPLEKEWWPSEVGRYLAIHPEPLGLRYTAADVTQLGFPKDRILMLTPDSPEVLSGPLEPDTLYVVGAMSDKGARSRSQKGYTYNRARELGIRAASLPLNEAVEWQRGKKSLSLAMCVGILLDVARTGDWAHAIQENIVGHQLVPDSEYSPMSLSGDSTALDGRLLRLLDAFGEDARLEREDKKAWRYQLLQPLAVPRCLEEGE